MKRRGIISLVVLFGMILSSCCICKKNSNKSGSDAVFIPGPKIIIYKTTKDYSNHVPVTLSDDRKSIESYPDIKDVFINGELAYPTKLHNGFLLDNRGINANTAFLEYTYEEYSKLNKTPDSKELMSSILDSDPISAIYMYSKRPARENLQQELNNLIDAGDFSAFTKIK